MCIDTRNCLLNRLGDVLLERNSAAVELKSAEYLNRYLHLEGTLPQKEHNLEFKRFSEITIATFSGLAFVALSVSLIAVGVLLPGSHALMVGLAIAAASSAARTGYSFLVKLPQLKKEENELREEKKEFKSMSPPISRVVAHDLSLPKNYESYTIEANRILKKLVLLDKISVGFLQHQDNGYVKLEDWYRKQIKPLNYFLGINYPTDHASSKQDEFAHFCRYGAVDDDTSTIF